VDIRPVRPDEYETLGAITRDAYLGLAGHVHEPDYEAELADVGYRAKVAVVLAAVEGDEVLGGVTYVGDAGSPLAEHPVRGAASIRMLAVAPSAQGRGVGEALTRACIDRAQAEGKTEVVLHSTTWMTTAHRLYGRLGFVRDETHDWEPVPGIKLLFFRLPLNGRAASR
jgi:ribosomal protein S18 acetylase RimI-like enzyme